MTNIAAGVIDIINDPASRGIGAGIQQTNTAKKTITKTETNKNSTPKNTIKSVLASDKTQSALKADGQSVIDTVNAGSKAVQNTVNEETIGELMKELLGGNNQKSSMNDLVDLVMKRSVDDILKDEIKKGRISLQTSKMGTTYATARAYYKKLYDGGIIITNLRNNAEKNISKAINQSINDKLASWQNKLPGWGKTILTRSKLASSLNKYISNLTKNCIEGIFGDSVIKNWNSKLIGNLEKLKKNLKDQFQKTFKGGIEYYQKLRNAIAEKIKVYQEMKRQFEKHIATIVNEYKQKIVGAIQDFTNKLIASIGDSVKSLISGIKL